MEQVFPDTEQEHTKNVDLIKTLMSPSVYAHHVEHLKLVETHISWVILTGPYAYKIKKPIDLGFLDFSSLSKRRFYCEEEVRLNKRLAAQIYLDVVAVTINKNQIDIKAISELTGDEKVIEYMVKMLEFPQDKQLDIMLERGELDISCMQEIAAMLAQFHLAIDSAGTSIQYGEPEHVHAPVRENFRQIKECIQDRHITDKLDVLEKWCDSEYVKIFPTLQKRKEIGFIRECHGDLHLRNIAWFNNQPVAFDCLEFNPELRWIDVMSELAFIYMDLQDRNYMNLAQVLLNRYLEITGDYEGIEVLPYYLVYRALVRAKVDAIRSKQAGMHAKEKNEVEAEFASYLDLAKSYTTKHEVKLILTRGVSASGKTSLTSLLMERMSVIRVRSDVERKRMYCNSDNAARAEFNKGIYQPSYSKKVYSRLLELAEKVLNAGFSVIVDASFLHENYRTPFMALAKSLSVDYRILEFTASKTELRKRIVHRNEEYSDADLKIQEQQLTDWQEVSDREKNFLIRVDTEEKIDVGRILEIMQKTS